MFQKKRCQNCPNRSKGQKIVKVCVQNYNVSKNWPENQIVPKLKWRQIWELWQKGQKIQIVPKITRLALQALLWVHVQEMAGRTCYAWKNLAKKLKNFAENPLQFRACLGGGMDSALQRKLCERGTAYSQRLSASGREVRYLINRQEY